LKKKKGTHERIGGRGTNGFCTYKGGAPSDVGDGRGPNKRGRRTPNPGNDILEVKTGKKQDTKPKSAFNGEKKPWSPWD